MANPTLHPVPDEDVADGSPTPEGVPRVPLGRLLVAEGLLTEAQVDDALFEGGQTGERLGEIVVRRGLLSEDEIAKVLAEQWSLSYVDRASIWFDGDALGPPLARGRAAPRGDADARAGRTGRRRGRRADGGSVSQPCAR